MDKEILEQKKANNKEFAKIASQAIDIKNKTKNNTSKLNNIKRYLQIKKTVYEKVIFISTANNSSFMCRLFF